MPPMPPKIRTTATVKAMLMPESPSAWGSVAKPVTFARPVRDIPSVGDECTFRSGVLKYLYPEQKSNLRLPSFFR